MQKSKTPFFLIAAVLAFFKQFLFSQKILFKIYHHHHNIHTTNIFVFSAAKLDCGMIDIFVIN